VRIPRAVVLVTLVAVVASAIGYSILRSVAGGPGETGIRLSPSHGPVGTLVTITGTGAGEARSVSFAGVRAPLVRRSASAIEARVPVGARTGMVGLIGIPGARRILPQFRVTQPNIVLILSDDQRWDELGAMPTVQSQLVGKGVRFTNGFVVNPLCCPSRTTILTGEYSHSTHVYQNHPPNGGFQTFEPEEGSTVPVWLQRTGYRTAMVGKYLNGYTLHDVSHVPPGWNVWDALALGGGLGASEAGYYHYTMSVDGKHVQYGSAPKDYSTDVLTGYATRFIRSVASQSPLFLLFAPRAPHLPTTPPPRYDNACSDYHPPRRPDYNERDVSDKPAFIKELPSLSPAEQAFIDRMALDHCRSLLGVDDSVKAILRTLAATGRLSTTLIVYASDNGFLFGEHRSVKKYSPYEESIRIPIVVRYDPITELHPRTDQSLLLNLDFAQTFAALGGVRAPGAEGRSFLPLLENPRASSRRSFLVEHWANNPLVPAYCAVRTTRYLFVKYETGEEELYDLRRDPYELQNEASNPTFRGLQRSLYERMVALCKPGPPGYTP
jgi:N-acetylglucosamine-6-sulfatase